VDDYRLFSYLRWHSKLLSFEINVRLEVRTWGTLAINQNGHRDGVKKSLNPEKVYFIYL